MGHFTNLMSVNIFGFTFLSSFVSGKTERRQLNFYKSDILTPNNMINEAIILATFITVWQMTQLEKSYMQRIIQNKLSKV